MNYKVVFEENEEGGYTVTVPQLPGCISEGDSFEEAKKNITEAIQEYLESLEKDELKDAISAQSQSTFLGNVSIRFSSLKFH
ncbi:type II toxin-antitoxin system HicB family antitoxin [Candidatus Woesebacteria bacterium]|nr:type II toxin-antitoxin system HicB family antitoxin [Candidatus Woesebacteria bacterium]